MSDTNRPTVAILLTPEMRAQLIPPAAEARLAEAANVVATLTDPALAHTADDGYQLDFALRSDAGDQTGTVGVPG